MAGLRSSTSENEVSSELRRTSTAFRRSRESIIPFTPQRVLAVSGMVLVAAIWATSFIGVRYLVKELGPFTLAGLRYSLGAVFLLPWGKRELGRRFPRALWRKLFLIGICQYTIANGFLFWSLKRLPAAAGALGSCLSSVPVLILSSVFLRERPNALQTIGLGTVVGGSLYFFTGGFAECDPKALGSLGTAALAFSVLPVLGRELARGRMLGSISLTALPLAIGGGLALAAGLAIEGVPHLSPIDWGIIVGLAAINTSLAYLLFNWALRELYALEANVIANLSPIGTAILAKTTLGEHLAPGELGSLLAIVIGASLTQLRGGGGDRGK